MKTEMKMIVASVVVLALALTAVSGITYSWFSDSETAKVNVTTGYVNIETIPEKMVLSSSGSEDITVIWSGSSIEGRFPYGPSSNHSASITKNESEYAIDIKGILSGDEVKFTINVTNKSSVPAYITCTSNENKTLFDVTIACSESLLDVPVDETRTFEISIKLASGVSLTTSETSTFNIVFTGYQGNYASTIHGGTATITGNKIISGDVTGDGSAKDAGIKVDFSEVTKVNDSIDILGSTITVKSKLTGGISNEFGTIELILSKDGTAVSPATFDKPVKVTTVFKNVEYNPGEVIIKCGSETISCATGIYDPSAKTFTVEFQTTHFSDFTILPIVAKIGSNGYTSVKAAFDAAVDENHIDMVNDSNETDQIKSTKTGIVLNLGNCNIVFENDGIRVESGSLTINGDKGSITGGSDGTPDKEDLPVYAMGGTLTINGGKFVSDSCAECIYAGVYAKIIINGGTFESTKPDMKGNGWLINVNNGGSVDSIVISGGSFKGYNPRTGDDSRGGSFLKSGYTINYADGSYKVIEGTKTTASVNTVEDLKTVLTTFTSAGSGNTDVSIDSNISLGTGDSWTSISVDGYNGAGIITIDGDGHTIYGLDAPLFAGGFAGKSGIVINNLTLSNIHIDDSKNTQGLGAFVGSVDSMQEITLTNCHLVNSTIISTCGARVGGLIGWTAGYINPSDGPVNTYVTVENCSVENVKITAKGSVGAIIGHAGANAATYQKIEGCTVKGCTLTSTDDGGWRVGVVVGTANVGQLTISGTTESGNPLSQTGKTAPAGQSSLYGRFVPGETGTLTIDSISIANSADSMSNAVVIDGKINIRLESDVKIGEGDSKREVKFNGEAKEVVIDGGETKKTITLTGKPTGYSWPGQDNAPAGFNFSGGDYTNDFKPKTTVTFKNIGFVNTKDNSACTTGANRATFYTYVYAENVVYEECTFTGGVVTYGNAKFVDCLFTENNSGRYALFIDEEYGTHSSKIELIRCTFDTTSSYGCVKVADDKSVEQTLSISDCSFSGTSSKNSAIYINGKTTVTTSGDNTFNTENGIVANSDDCILNDKPMKKSTSYKP